MVERRTRRGTDTPTLREPFAKLTDRILTWIGSEEGVTAARDIAGVEAASPASPAFAIRSPASPRLRPSPVRSALHRILPIHITLHRPA